jgi:dCTP diphosphatase
MSDQETTVGELKQLVENFVSAREWQQFHTPKNLSMAIAIEASELMDLFKWYGSGDSIKQMTDDDVRIAAGEELADVLILCIAFANRNGIDIQSAVERKVAKNDQKYPQDKFRGRF